MQLYVTRRLVQAALNLILISMLVFAIMRVLPGNVANLILGAGSDQTVDPAAVAKLTTQLGLDKPIVQQYVDWLGGVARLDFGQSLYSGRRIAGELGQMLVASYSLALLTIGLSAGVGLPLGIISAAKSHTGIDLWIRLFSFGGLSVPTFWLATLFILGAARFFHWIPPLQYDSPLTHPLAALSQLVWPALITTLHLGAMVARMARSSLLEVLREDHVRTARSKGLGPITVLTRHALRNALLPVITLSAAVFTNLLGTQVVMESIFAVPGLGGQLLHSILVRDYPVVQAIIMTFALNVVAVTLLTDLSYARLNPKIRY